MACTCPTNAAGDIRCHNCGERVNVRCWKCGTPRDSPCPGPKFTGRAPSGKPLWMEKHPCATCKAGWGECAQGLALGLMCCKACYHPTRSEGYTPEELADMKENPR